MKLQSRKQKNKTLMIVIIIAVAILAIVGVVVGVIIGTLNSTPGLNPDSNTPEDDSTVKKISVSSLPKTEYYVGEEFDWTGLEIQAVTNSMDTSYFVKYPNHELTITGFDSTAAGEIVVTVKYQEFTTTFKVLIKNYETGNPTLTKIEVQDMFLEYTVEEWQSWGPSELNAWLLLTYSDGSTKGSLQETPLRRGYITGWNPNNVYTPGETQITITYTEDGVTVSTTVTITITN